MLWVIEWLVNLIVRSYSASAARKTARVPAFSMRCRRRGIRRPLRTLCQDHAKAEGFLRSTFRPDRGTSPGIVRRRLAVPFAAQNPGKLLRDALATADSDLDRHEPRARPSRRAAGPAASSRVRPSRRAKRGKHRLALVVGGILVAAIAGIFANALLLQRTRHPAPLLGHQASAQRPAPAQGPARPPRPETQQPVAAPNPPQVAAREPLDKPVNETPIAPKARQTAATPAAAAKPSDGIGQLLRTSAREPRPAATVEPRPAAPVEHRPAAPVEHRPAAPTRSRPAAAPPRRPAPPQQPSQAAAAQPSRTVAAAQRALVKLGFVLHADGVAGASTIAAIERYERDRGLPARGTLSPDLVRRLAGESGIPID